MTRTLASLLSLAAVAGAATAAETAAAPKPYPLTTCIISGDKLGSMGDAVVVVREGREIKFCCKGCIKDFDKNPAAYIKQIEAAEKAPAAAAGGHH